MPESPCGLCGGTEIWTEQSLQASRVKAYAQPAVIVDPNIITGTFDFRQRLAEFIQRKWRSPALDALGKVVIETPLNKSTQPAINGRFRPARLKYNVMLRPAYVGVLLQGVNGAIGGCMRKANVLVTLAASITRPFFPGGNSPRKYPSDTYTLGSLNVAQSWQRSPSAPNTRWVKR